MKKVLLVEDDKDIVHNLTPFLQTEGYEVDSVDGQKMAMYLVKRKNYNIILLDISLKDGNGFSLYNEIKDYKDIPIVFLTASSDEFSIVTGLNLGADDYINKPFRPRVLMSRIDNILTRYNKKELVYKRHNLRLNAKSGKVFKNNQEIFLSALEYKLLLLFFIYPNQLLTREFLLEEIWSISGEDVSDNTLSVYMRRLRYKIEDDPIHPIIIKTKRGLGYHLGED
ncbi:MAG: response regulator transcription factor [Coprobacillus sp.]